MKLYRIGKSINRVEIVEFEARETAKSFMVKWTPESTWEERIPKSQLARRGYHVSPAAALEYEIAAKEARIRSNERRIETLTQDLVLLRKMALDENPQELGL